MGKPKDLTNIRFGNLVAIEAVKTDKGKQWRCLCDCGKEITLDASRLTSKSKTNCGCIKKKYVRRNEIEFPTEYEYLTKECTECKKIKPYKEFYFSKRYSNLKGDYLYFNPRCIECDKKSADNWTKNNKEQVKISLRKYKDSPKGKKAVQESNKRRVENGSYAEFIKNNPDKVKQYGKNHRNHEISKNEWKSCLDVFDYKCAYCGKTSDEVFLETKQTFHKEHVDDNGYNDLRNCVPACRNCNSNKWTFNFEEWYKEQKFFSQERLDFINWWISEGYKNYIEEKLPYRIIRKQNESDKSYHHELWSVDEYRNMIKCIATGNKKKDLNGDINKYLEELNYQKP